MAISDPLRTAIEAVHQAIIDEPDPEDKQTLSTCLQNMLKVQARNMQQGQTPGGGGARQAVASQLSQGY